MLATVAALLLSCKMVRPPPPPPVPVTVRCEGADQVSRNHDGLEVRRLANACTQVRCEGTDRVRRTYGGAQVSREVDACTVARCEGGDLVVRSFEGFPVSRLTQAPRCLPPEPVVVTPQVEVVRYGLSAR